MYGMRRIYGSPVIVWRNGLTLLASLSKLARSQVAWSTWLLIFLILEVGAAIILGNIFTLSKTSGIEESRFPWLRTILLGFLLGLAVHIRWQTPFFRTEGIGILAALLIDLVI